MRPGKLIGIDANEANLIKSRVGSNKFAYNILKALHTISTDLNFRIYLSTDPQDDMPKIKNDWEYRVIPPPKLWTQWRLPLDLYFHKPRPDLFLSLGHYAPRFSPVKTVVSIMDLGFLKFPEHLTKKDLYQLKSWTKYSAESAIHIVTISEFTKSDIVYYYNINPNKISVIYPGYDRDIFRPIEDCQYIQKVIKKYEVESPYILFVGALKPNKNLERLIEAFSLLKSKDLKLVIAGKKGWMYDSIFRKVSQLKLEKKVIFTGFIDEPDLPYAIAGADVFVLPSLYEGFGIPAVEAMACGTPVITSNAASLPEVVGNAGVIIDPYSSEPIAQGINIAQKNRDIYRKRGIERAMQFNWVKAGKKLNNLLKEL